MGNICVCCNHPKRLQIDRDVIQGLSNSVIAKKYGLANPDLVARHAKSHLSKQLVTAWEAKELDESMDLLGSIDKMLRRCERIFKRSYKQEKDLVALKALGEQRQTFQLLSNISFQLHQARLAELEIAQREDGTHEFQETEQFYEEVAEILTDHELMLLSKLLEKIETRDSDIDVIKEYLPDPVSTAMLAIEKCYMQANTPEETAQAASIASQYTPPALRPGLDRPHWGALDDLPPDPAPDPRKLKGPQIPIDPDPAEDPDPEPDPPLTRTRKASEPVKRGRGRPKGTTGSKRVREDRAKMRRRTKA
jgi:hypothetical protein